MTATETTRPSTSNLLVEGVDPDNRVLLLQGPGAECLHLGVQIPVELGDLGGRDVLDAHGAGQTLDLPGRNSVDERFLDDGDQGLLGSSSFRDEKRDVAAFSNFGNQKIDRSQAGIDSPNPSSGKISRSLRGVFSLNCADLVFRFDPHHLGHHPLEHGQEGIRLREELQ